MDNPNHPVLLDDGNEPTSGLAAPMTLHRGMLNFPREEDSPTEEGSQLSEQEAEAFRRRREHVFNMPEPVSAHNTPPSPQMHLNVRLSSL